LQVAGSTVQGERKRLMTHQNGVYSILLLVMWSVSLLLGAQSNSASDLRDGLDQFRNSQYDKAILLFHNVILDPSATLRTGSNSADREVLYGDRKAG